VPCAKWEDVGGRFRRALLGIVMPSHPLQWPSPPDDLGPPRLGEVHLWSTALDAVAGSGLASALSAAEQARAAGFRSAVDERRFVAGLVMRRSVLGRYLGLDPAAVGFREGVNGRPELAGEGGNLRFNVSHSGDIGLLAVTHASEIGVDVEVPQAFPDRDRVARDTFHPEEVGAIEALASEAEREAAFYRCWTRKEALAKAVGLGFHLPFGGFAVDVGEVDEPRVLAGEQNLSLNGPWFLRDLSTPPRLYAALAMSGRVERLMAWCWRP
jgi:4'-phosphopantetheinyl transferase